jgi:hypothetical protein
MDKRKTPRFLTLLCILSIASGIFAIKSSISNLFFNDEFDEETAYNMQYEISGDTPDFIQYTMDSLIDFWLMQTENSIMLNTSTLLLALISIVGVIWMYQLKSKGFALYAIANLLGVIIPFLYYLDNTVGQLFIAGQFFVTALFILMYASQLKHMRKKNEPLRL